MTFDDFPTQYWQYICMLSPIAPTFATTGYRIRRTCECLTKNGLLHRMFKPGLCAEKTWRWRGFNAPAKVIENVKFRDGIEGIESDRAVA